MLYEVITNIDQGILKSIQELNKTVIQTVLHQIDLSSKYREEITQMQISSLKIYDDFFHILLDSYAKSLSIFNQSTIV